LEAKDRPNGVKELNPYLKEKSTLFDYKEQVVYAVYRNNQCLFSQSYETHKQKIQSY
jgi:hypothetical protein